MNPDNATRRHAFLSKLEHRFSPYFWVIPVVSFAMGWASFVLVQRGEDLARLIALLALAGWVWILAEPWIVRRLISDEHPTLRTSIANFFSQSIQQEIFFFSLPFLFAATHLNAWGQIVFTGLVVAAALVSTIDPWYEKYISRYRLVSLAFHALCCFVSALVIVPIALKLPTEQTLIVAILFLLAWLVLALVRLFNRVADWKTRGLIGVGLCLIPVFIWLARASIPPAGLQATRGVVTSGVVDHEPLDAINRVSANQLSAGIYAHVAIKAPRGLDQEIRFEWRHQGESETIAAHIIGGRAEGYRTYSMKSNFPEAPQGRWVVDVRTAQGQLLHRLSFNVAPSENTSE